MKQTLSANGVKTIAIIAMTIDHIAWLLYPGYPHAWFPVALHLIGRITCPIMCYFIAEGYHHTRDINKYTARLFLFALLSHVPYMWASMSFTDWRSLIPFYGGSILNQTGVMWSLFCGLVMLRVDGSEKIKPWLKPILIILLCLASFPADWSCIAALCVLAFGTNRGRFKAQMLWMCFYVALYATVYFFALDKVYGLIQLAVVLAIPILAMYNGKRGNNPRVNQWMKWGFYIYYPLHLLILGWLGSL